MIKLNELKAVEMFGNLKVSKKLYNIVVSTKTKTVDYIVKLINLFMTTFLF